MIPFLVFTFCLFLTFGAYLFATRGSERRRVRLQQRLAEALLHSACAEDVEVQLARRELMSRALSAGHAFPESLHMVATEMPEPVATEFRKTYEEQNLGLSLKLALENLAARVPLLDLKMCITAIMIQRETGGNLAEILEKVAHTIRERFRIMEDLRTLTTSSRMSAWILCGLPIFVALAVTALNPEYMSVLWRDPRGHYLIAAAMTLQITGMLIIRKILKIKI